MIPWTWAASLSPGNEQLFRWSSQAAGEEGSFNLAGVRNPAADAMIDAMLAAATRDDFVAAVRALDRVLLSGDYVVPLFHMPHQWVAHWRSVEAPAVTPVAGYNLESWWAAPVAEKP
jgi:peptide/nickel transport system substrate-binding protein